MSTCLGSQDILQICLRRSPLEWLWLMRSWLPTDLFDELDSVAMQTHKVDDLKCRRYTSLLLSVHI